MIILSLIYNYIDIITNILKSYGIIAGILLVILESIIPALPLGLFITLNINAYGLVIGIIISWIGTCLGCYISYILFKFLSEKLISKRIKNKKLDKMVKSIKSISFSNLVVLIALPFTPAFLINIACGIAKLKRKKFVVAIMIGKVSTVLFWGCIGKSLLQSITDITTIIFISIFTLIAYVVSKIVSKKLRIE